MMRRIGLGILVLIMIVLMGCGAIYGYNYYNSTYAEETTDYATATPVVEVTPVPTSEAPAVVQTEVEEVVENTTVEPTEPVVTPAVVQTEVVESTNNDSDDSDVTTEVPVEVTATPAPVNETVDIPTEEIVKFYANSNGYLFAFKEKNVSNVTKTVYIENLPTTIQLKNGLVYKPVAAWMENDKPVEVKVEKVVIKNEELYTTATEVVENTVMTTEFGKAHRVYDEAKRGELVVTITISIGQKTNNIQVWYQEEKYVLRVYYEAKMPEVTPPPPTNPPPTATPRIPTDEPTATPTIPFDEPTATPTIPFDEPTATPRIPETGDIDWGFEGDESVDSGTINWGFEGDEPPVTNETIDWNFEDEVIVSNKEVKIEFGSQNDEDDSEDNSEDDSGIDWGFE